MARLLFLAFTAYSGIASSQKFLIDARPCFFLHDLTAIHSQCVRQKTVRIRPQAY